MMLTCISDLVTRIAKLEAAHKRAAKKSTVSRRELDFVIETIGRFVGKELDPILERLDEVGSAIRSGVGRCLA